MDWLMVGAVVIPGLMVPLIIWAAKRNQILRNVVLVLITSAILIMVLNLFILLQEGFMPVVHVFSMLAVWEIILKVDSFGLLFALLSSGLWMFTTLYAIGYMDGERNQSRFFSFLILCLGVTMGVAFSGNLFTLYLFYEILTFASYPLVVHYQSKEAMRAGRKYLVYSLSGAALILMGLILTYSMTERLEFTAGGLFGGTSYLQEGRWLLELLMALFVFGFGVKAAVMPLHNWLPSAMVAPTPVSALFHAVAVVNSGIFGLIRVLYGVFGTAVLRELWMTKVALGFALLTVLLGSAIAFLQNNLKRRLAYSTISQLGYIILGTLLLTPDGWRGGLVHILNHGLLKIVLFFCAGMIYKVTHKKEINDLDGIGKTMPLTMWAFAIASFGLIGIPPTNGFISKWYLLAGGWEAHSWMTVGVLLVSSLMNAGYFLPIVIRAFFRDEREKFHSHEGAMEAPGTMVIPVMMIVVLTLVFGMMPELPLWLVDQSIAMMGVGR